MKTKPKKINQKKEKNAINLLSTPHTIRRVVINNHNVNVHTNYLNNSTLCIVCDWFEVNGSMYHYLLQGFDYEGCKNKEKYTNDMQNGLFISYMGYGKTAYRRAFEVYYNGFVFLEIYAVPKFEKTMANDSINIKVANNLFYTKDWYIDYAFVIEKLGVKIKNITRLDIAIDGNNGLINFLTSYTKQQKAGQKIIRVGQAQLNPVKFKDSDLSYSGFSLGSRASEKYLVIYDKVKELEVHNKPYIKSYWINSGLPIEKVERVEIRLKSAYLGTIDNVLGDLKKIQDVDYLATIFKNSIEQYFDFRLNNSKNISHCDRLELINFANFNVSLLERTKKTLVDGRFRIKVSIKSAVESMLKGYLDFEKRQINIEYIKEALTLYSLHDWYEKKLPEWENFFKTNKETGHFYELSQL